PCPGCAAMIRVPPEAVEVAVPTETLPVTPLLEDPEKVSYAPVEEPPAMPQEKTRPASAGTHGPTPTEVKPHSEATNPPHLEWHCVCPVCQSEIKISVDAEAAPDEARNRKVARRVIDSPTAQERPAEPQV